MMANQTFNNQNMTPPTPQPRPALSLVGAPRVLPLDQYECFIGASTHVAELKEFISAQASHRQPALLIGERGLRQEQIARVLHQASEHWAQPFFAVNAHSLGDEGLNNLLFGPRGALENCQRGTIYVNELTRLPLLLQQRFAVYLEEQRWRARSGKFTNQRLIFATEWHPAEVRAENRLAYGLVELLRSSSFALKPLRERNEDIPYLAAHLTGKIAQRLNKGVYQIAPGAMKVLMKCPWERNIDELEAVLESAIACAPPQRIEESLLPSRIRYATLRAIPAAGVDLPRLVDDYEWSLLEAALQQTNGNQTRAARLLGLRVQTLNMKLKRFAKQAKVLRKE
jgi:DNA-binding NtrC family response regulator